MQHGGQPLLLMHMHLISCLIYQNHQIKLALSQLKGTKLAETGAKRGKRINTSGSAAA